MGEILPFRVRPKEKKEQNIAETIKEVQKWHQILTDFLLKKSAEILLLKNYANLGGFPPPQGKKKNREAKVVEMPFVPDSYSQLIRRQYEEKFLRELETEFEKITGSAKAAWQEAINSLDISSLKKSQLTQLTELYFSALASKTPSDAKSLDETIYGWDTLIKRMEKLSEEIQSMLKSLQP